jgi:hypothetical protein
MNIHEKIQTQLPTCCPTTRPPGPQSTDTTDHRKTRRVVETEMRGRKNVKRLIQLIISNIGKANTVKVDEKILVLNIAA